LDQDTRRRRGTRMDRNAQSQRTAQGDGQNGPRRCANGRGRQSAARVSGRTKCAPRFERADRYRLGTGHASRRPNRLHQGQRGLGRMKLAVLGAGAWGTAISISLAPRHAVTLWARDPAQARDIAATRINEGYLPGFTIPASVSITADLKTALEHTELLLIATPTAGLRAVLKQLAAAGTVPPLIWLCKGFEAESARLPHQIAAEELTPPSERAVLS